MIVIDDLRYSDWNFNKLHNSTCCTKVRTFKFLIDFKGINRVGQTYLERLHEWPVVRNGLTIQPPAATAVSHVFAILQPLSPLLSCCSFSHLLCPTWHVPGVSCPFTELELSLRLLCATKRLTSVVYNVRALTRPTLSGHLLCDTILRCDSHLHRCINRVFYFFYCNSYNQWN